MGILARKGVGNYALVGCSSVEPTSASPAEPSYRAGLDLHTEHSHQLQLNHDYAQNNASRSTDFSDEALSIVYLNGKP
jgi:hypothetical protein